MQNHYIIHKTILRFSHSFVEYGTPTSLKAPLEGSWRLSRLRGGFFIFSIATSPSLRDTSPQGEALPRTHTSHPYWTAHMTSLMAPLEGSWRLSRLRGGFFIFSIATSPSLRDTSPQGEALPRTHTSHPYWTAHMTSLMAPLEGSWRLSRLREDFFIFSIATSPSLRDTTLP